MTALPIEPLLKGEHALANAPHTELADGRLCIPQHYLKYEHTLTSVEAIVLDIDYDSRYPIFVSVDAGGIYIQIGVIGFDNYKPMDKNSQLKIVYGRKWRVEPQLPSSEIIQTVFLALKKMREHEIRELFRFEFKGKTTTPFNNHHDLPLLANSLARVPNSTCSTSYTELALVLESISYDDAKLSLINMERVLSENYLIELKVNLGGNTQLPELHENQSIALMVEKPDANYILHALMQKLVDLSDRHVDENFCYKNFARFSWNNSVESIAEISGEVRQLHKQQNMKSFEIDWQQTNYETDQSRIPVLSPGSLKEKIENLIERFSPIEATLPLYL